MLRTFLALLLLCSTAVSASAANWYDHYEEGVRLIAQGDAAAARTALDAALAARAEEGLQVPSRSQQYVDYLPHLYLAIAHQMSGDVERARKDLARAEASGVAVRSEVGRPLLVAYQLLLRGDGTRRFTAYDPKPPVFACLAEWDSPLLEEPHKVLSGDVEEVCCLLGGDFLADWHHGD